MAGGDKRAWWDRLPARGTGDIIIGEAGAGATGVAIGKGIHQIVTAALGPPAPGDKQIIEERLTAVATALQEVRGQLDATTAAMAEFQVQLLRSELTKIEDDATPSANTITTVGGWLLDCVPQLAEVLTGLFATPAVGKVVGKAGEAAVAWVKARFGRPAGDK